MVLKRSLWTIRVSFRQGYGPHSVFMDRIFVILLIHKVINSFALSISMYRSFLDAKIVINKNTKKYFMMSHLCASIWENRKIVLFQLVILCRMKAV